MADIRRAAQVTAAERYINLLLNLAVIAATSRLLTPEEIGVSILGAAILAIVEQFRDVPTGFIIQDRSLTQGAVQTCFTMMMGLSLICVAALLLAAPSIAAAYGDPGIATYFQVFSLALLLGPFERIIVAQFRREMSFGRIAVIVVAGVAVNAATAIALAWFGWSYMSFAWAMLAATATTVLAAFLFRPSIENFKPNTAEWRRILSFSGVLSLVGVMDRLIEAVPYFILGRSSGLDAVGQFNRAYITAEIPNRLGLAGFAPLSLPAFSERARANLPLHEPYLKVQSYVSAVLWPTFMMLALLAEPATRILLGPQWLAIVPLIQVIAVSRIFAVIGAFANDVLIARGRMDTLVRVRTMLFLISIATLTAACWWGATGLAVGFLIVAPLTAVVMNATAGHATGFSLRDLAAVLWPSLIVTLVTAAAPAILLMAVSDWPAVRIDVAILAGLLAIPGWLAGLRLVGHPLLTELDLVVAAVRRLLQRAR